MKQYPGEQQVIEEVLSAYRSAMKYVDSTGMIEEMYKMAEVVSDKVRSGQSIDSYRELLKEWVREIGLIHADLQRINPESSHSTPSRPFHYNDSDNHKGFTWCVENIKVILNRDNLEVSQICRILDDFRGRLIIMTGLYLTDANISFQL